MSKRLFPRLLAFSEVGVDAANPSGTTASFIGRECRSTAAEGGRH